MPRLIIILLTFLLATLNAVAGPLRLPAFFGDGMVLQRQRPIPVWGWAEPRSMVEVTLNGRKARAQTGTDGTWRVELPKQKAGGPYTMTITAGRESRDIRNVLVGDVYLCSGQSNMELPIRRCMDAVADCVKDYENPNVRYLKIPHQFNFVEPQQDMRTNGWVCIDRQNTAEMGALCYFLGRELQEATGVPIGIINSSVGGTKVDAWMRSGVLATVPGYADVLRHDKFHQKDWVARTQRAEGQAMHTWEMERQQRDTFTLAAIRNRARQAGQSASASQAAQQPTPSPATGNAPIVTAECTLKKMDVFRDRWQGGNGSYWLCQSVTLTAAQAAMGDAILRLGAMKDADSVWVNGHFVGTTSYEYPPRNYAVADGILHEGDNDIVVHLLSQNGWPNFTQGKQYQLEFKGKTGEADPSCTIVLSKDWLIGQGAKMPPRPTSTYFVDTPTGLYNAMIAPLQDFPFSGIVWYQGESDCGHPQDYAQKLALMTEDWRRQQQHATPLLVVQLAGFQAHYDKPVESGQAALRNQQRIAAQTIPHAALCTAIDIGEWNDIHPQRKHELGRRAALQMRRLVYGYKSVSEGPSVERAALTKDGAIELYFSKKTGKLKPLADNAAASSFAIQDTDGRWHWAEATVTGPYRISLKPLAGIHLSVNPRIRYAWDDFPHCSLYNEDGLPASSFEIECK